MSERAKQFMPFDALKGYKEELRKRERMVAIKKELTDDEIEELNFLIPQISKHMMVKVLYYDVDEYVEIMGIVTKNDINSRILKVVDKPISYEDINKIEILEKSI